MKFTKLPAFFASSVVRERLHMNRLSLFFALAIAPVALPPLVGAVTFQTIYHFSGSGDGRFPIAPLIIGPGGVLYGTTTAGGIGENGTVFAMTPPAIPGGQWSYSTVYSFRGGADGSDPAFGVTISLNGELLGTTLYGGDSNAGTVFLLAPPAGAGQEWSKTTLHSFNQTDGANPFGLAGGTNGEYYGTTRNGGTHGKGAVFAIYPPVSPGASWQFLALWNFADTGDGANPSAGVTLGPDGTLYGETVNQTVLGAATIFALAPPVGFGLGWHMSTLYSESYTTPLGGISIGPNGTLFFADPSAVSVVLALTPPHGGSSSWTLYQLADLLNGRGTGLLFVAGGVIRDASGSLYGTACFGGGGGEGGGVFQLTPGPPGRAWDVSVLHTFNGPDGLAPIAGLALATDGTLYGTTHGGGQFLAGTIFELSGN
jgi:hypothetical protein